MCCKTGGQLCILLLFQRIVNAGSILRNLIICVYIIKRRPSGRLFTFKLRCLQHPDPIHAQLQFLRVQLEGTELGVRLTELLSEQRFIALLFLFEFMYPADPALHDGRALAAAVNQVGGPLLILLCFLAHKGIVMQCVTERAN